MRIPRTRRLTPAIPTASMADISFLLIIFFMVTTVFQVDRTSVSLPVSSARDEIPRGSAFVVLGGDGSILFSDGWNESQPVETLEDVRAASLPLVEKDAFFPFVVKADGSVRCGVIDQALDALRRAKVQRVILLTNQEIAGG